MLQLLTLLLLGSWASSSQPASQGKPNFSVSDWSATLESCAHAASGERSIQLRFKATVRNKGREKLIVPRKLGLSGLVLATTPDGPKPWQAEDGPMYEYMWRGGAKPPQSVEPDRAEFFVIEPGGQQTIFLDTPYFLGSEAGSDSPRTRMGIRAAFLWDAGYERFPATAETAQKWRHIGALVYGQGVTDWVVVDIPAESECPTAEKQTS